MNKKYEFVSFNEAERDSSAFIKQESYEGEGFKGCSAKISKVPVKLEPAFQPYSVMDFAKDIVTPKEVRMSEPENKSIKWRYMRIWLADKDEVKSRDAFGSLLTKLGSLGHKFSVTLGGNKDKLMIIIAVDKDNVAPARNAITSIYPLSELDVSDTNPLFQNVSDNNCVGLLEFYTPPPYWSSLFVPEESFASTILPTLSSDFALGEMGFIQIIIQQTRNDWGSNTYHLSSAEMGGGVPPRVLHEWRMAGFGKDYSDKTKDKLNLPMYATTIRIAAFCKEEKMDSALKSLKLSVSGCLWRGQRLKAVTEQDYIKAIEKEKTMDMIRNSKSYRPGSLLSIEELSMLSPLPEKEDLLNERFKLERASGIYVPDNLAEKDGVFIGNMKVAGKKRRLFLEDKYLRRGVSIVGNMGSGKTTLIAQMIACELERIRRFRKEFPQMNMSMFVFDFSDDLYRYFLSNLKEEDIDYVDIFDPTIEGYVPAYNFVHLREGEDIDRKADNRTNHIRNLYSADEWSSGIGQIYRNAFPLVFADSKATLLDMRKILEDTPNARIKRAEILKEYLSDNRELNLFWERDFGSIDKRKKKLALTKLTKFLTDKRVQHMFGVKENRFNAHDIMMRGRCCPVNLDEGVIGRGAANFIAGCLGEDIYDATQARTVLPPNERELTPCRIFWDEFFRAPMKSFEQATVSFRRYNVSLILSYHFQEQLSRALQAGIKNLGTAIALKQGYEEARRASNTFLAKVTANQFMSLDQGGGFMIKPNSQIRTFRSEKQNAKGNEDVITRLKERNIRDNYVKVSDIERRIEEQEQEKNEEWAEDKAI